MDDIANVFTYFAGLADKDGGEMINSPIPNTTLAISSISAYDSSNVLPVSKVSNLANSSRFSVIYG
jgi:hypothetical protein